MTTEDLNKLSQQYRKDTDAGPPYDGADIQEGYQAGFKKALELVGHDILQLMQLVPVTDEEIKKNQLLSSCMQNFKGISGW